MIRTSGDISRFGEKMLSKLYDDFLTLDDGKGTAPVAKVREYLRARGGYNLVDGTGYCTADFLLTQRCADGQVGVKGFINALAESTNPARNRFAYIDADSEGYISREEAAAFIKMLRQGGDVTGKEAQGFVKGRDPDKDGRISVAEWMTGHKQDPLAT